MWEAQSAYPLRENIWQYLYEDKGQSLNCACRRNARKSRKQSAKHKRRGKTTVVLFTFLLITICMLVSLWMANAMPKLNQITKLIGKEKLTSLLNMEDFTSVGEECCSRVKYLALELSRAEKILRHTLRVRRTVMLTSETSKDDTSASDKGYIQGGRVTIGRDTVEWTGRVALWGVVPLWRAARPPDTVLALRNPTPADCWPFSGSHGEIMIEFPRHRTVRCISIEHVRPDTANSAPKDFVVYGVLENGTWIKGAQGEYSNFGPAKQYYPMLIKKVPLKRVAFRVLSNQGNPKYTCLYRFRVYGDMENNFEAT